MIKLIRDANKIKLIIFDLDGVLIDSKEIHFRTLNQALEEIAPACVITPKEHLSTFDGLSTLKKLSLLSMTKALDSHRHQEIWKRKQELTTDALAVIQFDQQLHNLFVNLWRDGYRICVCSNAIRSTVDASLKALKITGYIDYALSNDDVNNPKPAAEIYLRAMLKCGADPKETIIVEDSLVGRQAALASGAHLHAVKDTNWDHQELINHISMINNTQVDSKWHGGKMNVLIPMAGAGSRFEKAGYTFPKPLIEVRGKPMIQVVVENLNVEANYIFIAQNSHIEKYNLKTLLNLIAPNCTLIGVDGVTEGAACTTLLAEKFINNEEPLLIANSDQFVEWNANEFYYAMEADKRADGGIVTFKSTHPKWSFVELEGGLVVRVAEKNPISDNATVGIYYWKRGMDYVSMAKKMIACDDRTNGEFYVAPTFNHAIIEGARIKTFEVSSMWGLGTPEDLNYYLENHK